MYFSYCAEGSFHLQAIAMLDEAQENARLGKHQYLSGVLHNVAKILTHEGAPADPIEALKELGFSSGVCGSL